MRALVTGLRRGRALALAAVLAGGCSAYTLPSRPAPLPDVHLAAAPDVAFAVLLAVYSDLEMPIDRMDGAARYLRSGEMLSPPRASNTLLFDCGQAMGRDRIWRPRAAEIPVRSRLTTVMIPDGEGTRIQHRVEAAGGGRAAGIACFSRGNFELQITEEMQSRLPPAGVAP